jgi:hypothetical protein
MVYFECLVAITEKMMECIEKTKAMIKNGQEEMKATVCAIWDMTEDNQEKMVSQMRAHREEMMAMRDTWLGKIEAKSKPRKEKIEAIQNTMKGHYVLRTGMCLPPCRVRLSMFYMRSIRSNV